MTPDAVTYVGLPISSGGAHSLGALSRRAAYEQTMAFLRTCTRTDGPVTCMFRVNDVPQLGRVPSLERELTRRFPVGTDLGQARVPEALDFLDQIDPQPVNRWGMAPVWFWVRAGFKILDPLTGQLLPGQDPARFAGVEYQAAVLLGTSGLHLILHNRAQLGIELCIPSTDEAVLSRIVPWLQASLPCRLSPTQWRMWTPTKAGTFKSRRLARTPA